MFSVIVATQYSLQHPGWSQADFSATVRADLINGSFLPFSIAVVTAVASPLQHSSSQAGTVP